MPKLCLNCPFAPKEFFGKIDCYHWIPTVFFHATIFLKSPQRANNKTEGCIILVQTGCELLLQTRKVGKVDQSRFVLAIVSHHAMPYHNIYHRVDHEYKVA